MQEALAARGALDGIDDAVHRIQAMNHAIATAAEEQSVVAHEISKDLLTISTKSARISEGADEVARTSSGLADLSSGLEGLVGQFRASP